MAERYKEIRVSIDQVCINQITFLTLFSLLFLIPSVNHMKLQTLPGVMNKVLLKPFYCIQISALIREKSKVEGHQKVIQFRHTWSSVVTPYFDCLMKRNPVMKV